jgi:hypothetical protein
MMFYKSGVQRSEVVNAVLLDRSNVGSKVDYHCPQLDPTERYPSRKGGLGA